MTHETTMQAFLDLHAERQGRDVIASLAVGDGSTVELTQTQLRAVLVENARMRAELERLTPRKVTCPVCQRPTKLTATGLIRYHGPHSRPCKGSSILPEVEAEAAPQQPARDTADDEAEHG